MHTQSIRQESDLCYCIYEFIKCEKNLDCISCEIAIRYWDEIKKSIEEKIESTPERIDIINERVTN